MTILRTGSSKKYAANWDQAFGSKPKKKTAAKKSTSAGKKSAKKSTKKAGAKKAGAKKKSS